MAEKAHVEELVKENKTLRASLEESKLLLQSLTEQLQEVMAVNHAVTVQLEQAADVRKYLGKINSEFNTTVKDCKDLINGLNANQQGSSGEASGPAGSRISAASAEITHSELKKLHAKNLELERANAEMAKAQARQKTHMLKQDRWMKQLSNVVATLSQKLEDKGEKVHELIETQLETTKKLNESESTLAELSKVNKELFTKLKHALAGKGSRVPEGGDMVQKVLGENMQLKADLKIAQQQLKKAYEKKAPEQEHELDVKVNKLQAKIERLEKLRKATNVRAHSLAQEKQALAARVQQQKEVILGLRRKVGSSGGGSRPTTPRW
eukprot:CAMPEP_0170184466 /NCGR_PEP_ID=MMETSP0040_2-20121228/33721_1 /TAXON_ID=641309 /ORGANISM="Lotharella oceanica, Strain CCMP622" /LENGTH=323 /DNA_ID=CAMNT_0010430545 /DNA_START=67 /DNA_END=1035 /DNA_ORIENTATION=-